MKKKRVIIAILLLLLVLLILDNGRVGVTRYSVATDIVHEDIKIVQISDFHNSRFGNTVLNKTKEEAPDIIAVTGDLIDMKGTDVDTAITLVKGLVKIAPVYYVTGNHEYASEDYSVLKDKLEKCGVTVLEQESLPVSADVSITGIDDPSFTGEFDADSNAIIDRVLDGVSVDQSKYNVLLSHRAEAMDAYSKHGYDLVLSGHAHGGQFRIPFIGGLIAPDQGWLPKYDAGEYTQGKTTMIVSRGIGNSIIPVRVNNPPEIVVVSVAGE